MSARRRREFAAGRYYARKALCALGCAPGPITVQQSRAPVWPQNVVGTIAHSHGICAAAVASRTNLASIGIDIEHAGPLPADLIPLVCRTADLRCRHAIERATGTDLPKLVFVLKEAFYKAHYAASGCFLDFVDVEVKIHAASFAFEAWVVNKSHPSWGEHHTLGGKFGCVQDTVFAVAWLASSEARSRSRAEQVA
jgi:4'-phosphopantetheinyl transferase EntD